MRTKLAVGLWAILATMAGLACAQEMPEMPKPTKEHEALAQFAGEWTVATECVMPGQEPMKCDGAESATMLGGFWLMSRGEADMGGEKMGSILTVGYDPETKKYVGTFVCSAGSYLWKYTGAMDASGKKLTLDTEGPLMTDPTKTAKYRETLELVDKDHKTFTSMMQGEDGKWVKVVTMEYSRKK